MARPRIAITTNLELTTYGAWKTPAVFAPIDYVTAVQRAAGLPLLVAPEEATADELLDLVDGVLLSGGVDLDPASYGADAHPETKGWVTARDRFELALTRGAEARGLPVLGICRGMQLLNVARGGTLLQHVPELVGHDDHRRHLGTFDGNDHDVRLQPGSLAARAAGEELHPTLSHHHQAIDRVGDGLVVTGWSVQDDLPEAIEDPSSRFVLGVQWHPEADETSRVVASLVDAARSA